MEEVIKTGIVLMMTEGVKELVKACVNSYIKPKLDNKYKDSQIEEKFNFFEEHIQEYLERSFNNNLIMNTIVFKNSQKTIDDLYIQLTIQNICLKNGDMETAYINKYPENIISQYRKLLLVDNAGMGKSTILKFLYLSIIRENKGIPILIELRKLEKDISIVDYITSEMNGIKEYFKRDHVIELIEGGDFIFLFDGYDEIVQENKEYITRNLQEFIRKCDSNKFIMTSREENELNCFGDFQRFDIKSLTKAQAYKLIMKYDENGEISKKLIEKLKTEENLRIIKEFLGNPLMVSLLYKAFEYKETIPYKKDIFYRQVYDALFEEHDLSKPGAFRRYKKSELDIESFHKVLRSIGFRSLKKGIIYSKEELVNMLNQIKIKNININFRENDFIDDITYSVPLFIKEGSKYRWAHKSFQEYFAASYICNDSKERESIYLAQMTSNANKVDKYYNVLDFCYDIDYNEFLKTVMYDWINKYIEFYNTSYGKEFYSGYSNEEIELRKSLEFLYDEIEIASWKKHGENVRFDEIYTKIFPKFSFEEYGGAIYADGLIEIYKEKSLKRLIKLLVSKKSDLVKIRKNIKSDDNWVLELESKITDKPIKLTQSIENILNNKENFNLFNIFLLNINSLKEIAGLDIEECLKIKEYIENQLLENETIDIEL
ncbi:MULTISPECIES: NACHT domain-containing protein [unclassified Clostridium]|uniref:NACHT domain-containing protein n=1 Tax=unclassified Clostridium TaxID=2614128 RepID=UPI00207A1AC5|nr:MULTISPECIES: NACHT domain-containing protein [unclassified Clostridium]